MGRSRLGVLTGLAFLLAAGPARAAEATRVMSAEPGDPFALQLSVRWDRAQERASITRDRTNPDLNGGLGGTEDARELRWSRVKNDLVSRMAVALYEDLELHVEVPYSLADDTEWRYGRQNGFSVGPTSSIAQNDVDAMGRSCGAPGSCPLFAVPQTVFHGGKLGDVSAGLAWAIFNDRRDDTKPTWVVGFDVTFPSSAGYDPAESRSPSWQSPNVVEARRGPTGEKVWKWDVYTAMSRRIGPVDPYFKAHATAILPSADTYSNCEHAAELASLSPAQMTLAAAQNCDSGKWKDDSGAKLPVVAGLLFGTELVPFEDKREEQKVTLDVRLFADYTSSARFYNELTDASGKLHLTEGYLTMGGRLGLYLKASRWVSLHAAATIATRTSHYLSGESLGKSRGEIPAGDLSGATANADLNPNFDWRYDAPGSRFRISEVADVSMSVAGVLQF
jgi:hypothetical protein